MICRPGSHRRQSRLRVGSARVSRHDLLHPLQPQAKWGKLGWHLIAITLWCNNHLFQMCYWLLKDKCPKPDGFLPDWFVDIPPGNKPPYQPPKQPAPGKPTTRFMFFTDMHTDVRYKAGASAVCGEPLCCRNNDPAPHDGEERRFYLKQKFEVHLFCRSATHCQTLMLLWIGVEKSWTQFYDNVLLQNDI